MKDLSLKFADRDGFTAFIESIDYHNNESIQDGIMLDVIGSAYRETGETNEDGEPVYIKEEGFFVNVRVIDDAFIPMFDGCEKTDLNLRDWM
ncbi:hypothetical protein RCU81_01640 [Escherichia coli]|uniref:hypothetical protein n=1 Tax=Escherichia coli TaxID=562 RepID=UPI001761322E|nr:hypothetical protein [Escherichia coli]EFH8235968.1 hypothetical protein [Escherichia coli]EGL2061948.1 hypothetical protein [Escherichia coli]EHD2947062.1 hypothetical protein [Escherichia coli]MBB7876738.1 hypothetical protein [Escherichia coli]MBB7881487.1 hypothetical protein [Escherichia coli]